MPFVIIFSKENNTWGLVAAIHFRNKIYRWEDDSLAKEFPSVHAEEPKFVTLAM